MRIVNAIFQHIVLPVAGAIGHVLHAGAGVKDAIKGALEDDEERKFQTTLRYAEWASKHHPDHTKRGQYGRILEMHKKTKRTDVEKEDG